MSEDVQKPNTDDSATRNDRTHNDNPQTAANDVNRTIGSGYAGAGGTPEDYRTGSDDSEPNEPTGDTNIANAEGAAGNAPIAGEVSTANPDRENHPVPGSGGDVHINATGAQASSISGNTTTAGGD